MTGHDQSKSGVFRFLVDNSLLLIAGAVAALVWANWADQRGSDSYREFVHFDIRTLWGGGGDHSGHAEAAHAATANSTTGHSTTDLVASASASHSESDHGKGSAAVHDSHDTAAGEASSEGGGHHWYHLSFIINDLLMALFFAIAAKEVWESLLPGGALSNPRKAATPLLATVGGILGPVLFYLSGAYLTGSQAELGQGWAIPCATDIAFSYLIARMIFGGSHPAIAFLLLLAIADDAIGLMILAVFYPAAPIEPMWLLLTVGAMTLAWMLRKLKVHSHWAYMLGPGALCWFSFYQAHIHPALGLVPIIPFLPSAASDLGIFVREELERKDTLNEFEHFWKTPVEFFLGLFGLVNAGVVLSSVGTGTWLVLAGLLLGKPLGIALMTLISEKGLGLEKPSGMDYRHVVVLGMVSGIGFTVALFVSVAAFRVPGPIQDSVKMGALLSFAAAPLALLLARVLGVRPLGQTRKTKERASGHEYSSVQIGVKHATAMASDSRVRIIDRQ